MKTEIPNPKKINQSRESRGRKPTYNWDKWFSNRFFTLSRGKDFHCSIHGMLSQIRNKASNRKLKVAVNVRSDKIIAVSVTRR